MHSLARARADLVLGISAVRATALLALLVIGTICMWSMPFFWLAFGSRFISDPMVRGVISLNLLLWWCYFQASTIQDFRAIHHNRRRFRRPEWFVQVPHETQAWASELVEEAQSRFRHLQGRVHVCFSFVPGVEFERIRSSPRGHWRMVLGISALAFVSARELRALLLFGLLIRFHPKARAHSFYVRVLREAERAQSTLPPHSGLFSFTRWFIERLVRILRPLANELESWAANRTDRDVGQGITGNALKKTTNAFMLQKGYLELYQSSAVNRCLMPPYVEGMSRLYSKILGNPEGEAVFSALNGLWVYERKLLEGCFGRDCVNQLKPISWDDLHQDVRKSSTRECGTDIRVVLGDSKIIEIPKLMNEWRTILRHWFLTTNRAPAVTPDRQREIFLLMLGSAFGHVLMEAGWEVSSTFGEELMLTRHSRTLHPGRLVKGLASGEITPAQFRAACDEAGVGLLSLRLRETQKIAS